LGRTTHSLALDFIDGWGFFWGKGGRSIAVWNGLLSSFRPEGFGMERLAFNITSRDVFKNLSGS